MMIIYKAKCFLHFIAIAIIYFNVINLFFHPAVMIRYPFIFLGC